MPPPTVLTGPIARLEDALAEAVAGARRGGDALAPVTVLAGHVLLRPYLRRALAARGVAQINVRYARPHELAVQIASEDAALRQMPRLTPAAERLLVREVAAGASGYFREIAAREGFADALGRLFREFELGGVRAGEELVADAGAKVRELVALYQEYERRRAGFATIARHYDAAIARLASADGAAAFEGPLLVYGLWAPSHLQLRLVASIAERAAVTVFLPRAGEVCDAAHAAFRGALAEMGAVERDLAPEGAPADAAGIERVGERVFGAHDGARIETDAVTLINAPDTVREVWEAARACLRWAEQGIGFHEMAVAYRNADPYRALVDEIFTEANIETYLHDGRLLSTHPLGRRVLSLIDLARDGTFSRAKVMEFLTETELPAATEAEYGSVRPSEWEAFTREAGIVEGIEQWRERLQRLANEKREESKNEGWERLADVAQRVEVLLRFAEDFHSALAARPEEARWEEHLAFARGLVARYATGTAPVLDALDELRALASVRERATYETFARVVRDDLERRDTTRVLDEPVRLFGRQGVAVIDASSLRHLRFRAVYMLGVAERAWPPPRRPDPLLLEHERRAINDAARAAARDAARDAARAAGRSAEVPLRTEPDDEPLGFVAGVQAAREQLVASFARADAGRTGKHLPSYFFRALAEAIEGRRVALDELDALSNVRRLAAGRLTNDDIDASLSRAEYDRGLIRASNEGTLPGGAGALALITPSFGRAVRARRERRGRALSGYDGVMIAGDAVAGARGLSVFQREGASVSASRLETYATCPYRYFLHYTLRITPVEEPEAIERMDHLQRGSLIHEILQKFLVEIAGEGPRAEARERHLEVLMRIAREEGEERVRRGVTGRPLIWQMDKRLIDDDLVRWYDAEMKDARATGMLPGAFEARFGPGGYGFGMEDASHSTDEPLELNVGGRTVRVQGRIDRIDWNAVRTRFRVIDYKTGRKYAKASDRFAAGTALQLPIYLRAAARMLGLRERDGEAQYFYVSSRGNFGRHVISGEELMASEASFARIIETIAAGVDGGYFAPNPEKRSNCQFCDYRDVCDVQIAQIMKPKMDDPRAAAFIALEGIE